MNDSGPDGTGEKHTQSSNANNQGRVGAQVTPYKPLFGLSLVFVFALSVLILGQSGGAAAHAGRELRSAAVSDGTPLYGVSFINSAELLADDQQLANGLATGATWDRWPVYWFYIETSPGSFDWTHQDAAVQANIDHGIELNAILLGTPSFYTTGLLSATEQPYRHPPREGALSLQAVETAQPRGLYEPVFTDGDAPGTGKTINPNNKWAVFVAAAVNRYKPGGILAQEQNWPAGTGVTVWEMWNEPDVPFFWDASVTAYARLLKVGYLAAKHADPDAEVMFGGLAMWQYPDYYEQVLDIYDRDSLADGLGYFHNIMAIHNYSRPERSSEYVLTVDQAMSDHGLEKSIWLNESGVPAWDDYPGPVWEPLSALRATQHEQANFTIQSAFYALSAGADALFYFQLYDGCGNQPQGTDFPPHNGELCDANNNYNGLPCAGDAYGLYRNPIDAACFKQHPHPETPRPSFSAYKVLTTHVQNVQPYWRLRTGSPIYSSTCPYSDGTQEWIALYQPQTQKRIVGMWARCGRDETAVIEATDPDGVAKLVTPDGTVQEVKANNGFYSINLPRATNRNPHPGQAINPVYGIGGRPVILIETEYRDTTPTPTATDPSVNTATPTNVPVCNQLIVNGGFEENSGWVFPNTPYPAGYSTAREHSGNRSVRAGIINEQDSRISYSTTTQTVSIPAGAQDQILRFWLYTQSSETSNLIIPADLLTLTRRDAVSLGDFQMVLILDSNGTVVERLLADRLSDETWLEYSFDLSHYADQTIQVYFGVFNDGANGVTGMYVDDVSLGSCDETTPTTTPTNTATPTSTATPTNTATPTSTTESTSTATPTNTASPTNTAVPTETVLPTETATHPATMPYRFFAPTAFNDFPLGISGRIIDQGGNGVSGVKVITNGVFTTFSDLSGEYAFDNLDTGVYHIQPESAFFTFQPPSRTITIPPGAPAQDFLALPSSPYPGP